MTPLRRLGAGVTRAARHPHRPDRLLVKKETRQRKGRGLSWASADPTLLRRFGGGFLLLRLLFVGLAFGFSAGLFFGLFGRLLGVVGGLLGRDLPLDEADGTDRALVKEHQRQR